MDFLHLFRKIVFEWLLFNNQKSKKKKKKRKDVGMMQAIGRIDDEKTFDDWLWATGGANINSLSRLILWGDNKA